MRQRYTNVRARSANVGSGIAGCWFVGPEPACCLAEVTIVIPLAPQSGLLSLYARLGDVAIKRAVRIPETARSGPTGDRPPSVDTRRV
jgi:hypothetical protein